MVVRLTEGSPCDGATQRKAADQQGAGDDGATVHCQTLHKMRLRWAGVVTMSMNPQQPARAQDDPCAGPTRAAATFGTADD